MKIAIVTFIEALENYGQVLQSYALQNYLNSKEHECFIINYDLINQSKKNYLIKFIFSPKNFLYLLKKFITKYLSFFFSGKNENSNNSLPIDVRAGKFKSFKSKYLRFSCVFQDFRQLKIQPPFADLYIVGSDQVWNPELNNEFNTSFLTFAPKKSHRISYAASSALSRFPLVFKIIFKILVKNLDYISVREFGLLNFCHSVGRTDAVMVPDPVFLLEKEEWQRLMKLPERILGSYIFAYTIGNYLPGLFEFLNTKRVVVTCSAHNPQFPSEVLGVEEWIGEIYSSTFVVTNSFHGVVFCLILERNFFCYSLKKNDDRILSILKIVGLEHRFFNYSNANFKESDFESCLNHKIDWVDVKVKLDLFKKIGIDFLNNALKKKVST